MQVDYLCDVGYEVCGVDVDVVIVLGIIVVCSGFEYVVQVLLVCFFGDGRMQCVYEDVGFFLIVEVIWCSGQFLVDVVGIGVVFESVGVGIFDDEVMYLCWMLCGIDDGIDVVYGVVQQVELVQVQVCYQCFYVGYIGIGVVVVVWILIVLVVFVLVQCNVVVVGWQVLYQVGKGFVIVMDVVQEQQGKVLWIVLFGDVEL